MPASSYEFEGFELNLRRYELRRNGHVVKLEKIPMKLLILLVSRDGDLVTREEIVDKLWGKDVFVETEHSVNTAVRKIRHALDDDSDSPRFVVTVPTKGYRFVAEVHETNHQPFHRGQKTVHSTQTSIVGRERELAELHRGLDDAASGRGRLLLISGEPGIGKTRLADEIAGVAEAKRLALLGLLWRRASAAPAVISQDRRTRLRPAPKRLAEEPSPNAVQRNTSVSYANE